jgi:hypothetical protein
MAVYAEMIPYSIPGLGSHLPTKSWVSKQFFHVASHTVDVALLDQESCTFMENNVAYSRVAGRNNGKPCCGGFEDRYRCPFGIAI